MKYLSHKTADIILDHNFAVRPLFLYVDENIHEYFESLMFYVHKAASPDNPLKVEIINHTIYIRHRRLSGQR